MRRAEYIELPPPPLSREEIFRYMGCPAPSVEVRALAEEMLASLLPHLSYRACYRLFSILDAPASLAAILGGETAKRRLGGSTHVLLFAATVGHPFDRLLAKESRRGADRAFCLQAIGAERIEALCDSLEEVFADKWGQEYRLHPRFSPGYGDLPLTAQKEIFSLLDCESIGITLCDSLVMSPSKSVTALVGMELFER